ncbi:AMIN domain-containing protein, partial [bacterium]|nr:AMIN domain-containing protein [bacterium]
IGLALIGIFFGAIVFAQEADFKVSKIEVKESADSVQVLIISDGPVKYKSFSLDNPPRIRLFLPNAQLIWKEKELDIKRGLVKRVEALQYSTKPNIIQIEIYLAYQTAFELKPDEKLLTLEIAKEVPPTPRKIRKEARRRYEIGKGHYRREEFKEAIGALQEALKLNPKLSRAKNYIQKAELAIKEREKLDKERIEVFKQKKIKEEEKKRQEARREAIEKHYAEGLGYYKEGKLIEAIEEWNKVLALEPEHKAGKEIAKAEEVLERIIGEKKIEKEEAERAKRRQEELAKERRGAEEKRKLIKERKSKIIAHYDQGKSHYGKGEFEKALTNFQKVLALDPEHKGTEKYLAKCQKEIEKLKGKEARRKIADYFQKGEKFYREDKYLEAIDEFKKTLALNPEHVEARKYLTKSQENLKEIKEEEAKKSAEERVREIAEKERIAYEVEDIQVIGIPDKTRIVILTDKEGAKYAQFSLTGPPRLVIDIPNATLTWEKKEIGIERSVVKRVRAGQFSEEPRITRVVLDLKEEAKYALRSEENRIILEVENPLYVVGITDVSLKKLPEKTRITVTTEEPVKHSAFNLLEPPVVVIDMYGATMAWPQKFIKVEEEDIVKGVRSGQFEENIARVVIDLREMTTYRVSSVGNKIVVDLQRPAIPAVPKPPVGEEKLLSMDFKDADIHNVLRIIGQRADLNIIAGPELTGTVTISFKGVTAEDALNAILRVRGFGYERKKDIIRVMRLAKEIPEIETTTRIFELNYAEAPIIKTMLVDSMMLSVAGRVIVDVRSNTLMVIDTPVKIEEIGRMIARLDMKPLQVAIESKIIEVRLRGEEELGIDWTWVKKTAEQMSKGSDIDLGFVGTTGFFKYGTIGKSDFAMILQALAKRADTQIISNPKITTLDNVEAVVKVQSRYPYVTEVEEEIVDGKPVTRKTWEEKDVGVSLTVTPHIGKDDYITMKVNPVVSVLQEWTAPPYPYPVVMTREATTNVMVKDGDTLVIGGLIEEEERTTRSGVPGLMKVPVIKYLFSKKVTDTIKSELIIFVTPHIVRVKEEKPKPKEEEVGLLP